MPSTLLQDVIEQVKSLSAEERKHLRRFLDTTDTLPPSRTADEDEQRKLQELERQLVEKGIISRIPPPITDFSKYENRRAIKISGKPLSETIIEERR